MRRASCLLGILAVAAWAVPGCSGTEFTAADESDAGEAGEATTGGKGGSSGQGGSSSGTNSGGSSVGGNGNGGSSRGGNGGTSTGGSQTGGNAGDGASGGSDPGGMGGTSGASVGGAGTGSGGDSGRAGAGAGGLAGAGSGGKGGAGGAGSGGKGGTGGAGSGGKGGTGGAGPNTCPPNAPSVNSACSFMGHCSYGTHPLQRCRDVYACNGTHWQQTQDANCQAPPSCQERAQPPVINQPCMPEGAECQGANNLYCLCAPSCGAVCSEQPIWHCFGVPGDCPEVLPNRGQPCDVNLSCVYGSCATQTGVQAICENGVWVWYGLVCPA